MIHFSSPSSSSEALDPLWAEPMVNFENEAREYRGSRDGEDYDDGCGFRQPSAKKRRLSPRQVQFLEKSFDEENKLEPERKAQLAEELGLQARQVAIWFQNRRARFKTKQLEKEYVELKDSYDKLKAQCECLLKEKEQLKEEVLSLKEKLLMRGKGKEEQSSSEPLEPDSSVNVSGDQKPNIVAGKELPDREQPASGFKQEEETSASLSSGVLDPNCRALLLEPANSSHASEPNCSDLSQEEGDNLEIPGIELGVYSASPVSSCGFEFMAELDQQLWSWPY